MLNLKYIIHVFYACITYVLLSAPASLFHIHFIFISFLYSIFSLISLKILIRIITFFTIQHIGTYDKQTIKYHMKAEDVVSISK